MKNRWSVRAKIIAMMTVPLVMLIALWGYAVSITLPSALDLRGAQVVDDRVGAPAETMVVQLQHERQLTAVYAASGRKSGQQAVQEQRRRSDEAVAAFRRLSASQEARDAAPANVQAGVDQVTKALGLLDGVRAGADGGGEPDAVRAGFSTVVNAASGLFEAASDHEDSAVAEEARGVFVLSMARELLSEEDALVSDFITEQDYTAGDYAQVVSSVGQIRLILPYAATLVRAPEQAMYGQLMASPEYLRLKAVEDQLMATTPGKAAGLELSAWRAAFDPVNAKLVDYRRAVQQVNLVHAADASNAIVVQLATVGVIGLLALVASLLLSVRIGRSLARRLDGLRSAARELAERQLPSVVSRLRAGAPVDVAAEAPALELGTDEIGQVAEAFNSVQRTAVASAVEEASVRQGMNEVFLNIARRSQTLLHRQLSLLDGMERRTSEPDDLADLFRVDHLATRMRRHAEDLVILAGAAPGRGWRSPVPVIDVVRGAVSEVEDYARVQVAQIGEGAVVGRAVGDIIHLLAELIENATAYSPPHTRVLVTGQLVPNGFVVEIEDRGLGMTQAAIAEANRRLVQPPEFDPANSARLGLFVVAQLAARHRVQVVLRSSPYGGVTAVALLPTDLVVAQRSEALPVGASEDLSNTHELRVVAKEPFTWLAQERVEPTQVLPASSIPQRPVLAVVPPQRAEGGDVPGPAGLVAAGGGTPAADAVRPAVSAKSSSGQRGLPKRVRQQHISPKLAVQEPVVSEPEEVPGPEVHRSPEQLRKMMSSFQAGTARGRHATTGERDSGNGTSGDNGVTG